jgi:hypothetical protein
VLTLPVGTLDPFLRLREKLSEFALHAARPAAVSRRGCRAFSYDLSRSLEKISAARFDESKSPRSSSASTTSYWPSTTGSGEPDRLAGFRKRIPPAATAEHKTAGAIPWMAARTGLLHKDPRRIRHRVSPASLAPSFPVPGPPASSATSRTRLHSRPSGGPSTTSMPATSSRSTSPSGCSIRRKEVR